MIVPLPCPSGATWRVIVGDARDGLRSLAAGSVQCCVTSPPYWGLRDYGVTGQMGLEPTPDEYTARLVGVLADARRVLADDGVLWLNLGDSYTRSGGVQGGGNRECMHMEGTQRRMLTLSDGMREKNLTGIPWRVAFALQADGWYLRADCIWAKPNPMPESVTDRPTRAHEYVFLLSKQARYFYDAAAVREPDCGRASGNGFDRPERLSIGKGRGEEWTPGAGRNLRDVWTIPTQPYAEAHFATFPEALARTCILSGSRPGDTVLDPFAGSGTVGAVAVGHSRSFVGVELSPAYAEMARRRIGASNPMFASEAP